MDPAEVRRRNFIAPDKFPYKAPMGANYDSGDYATNLDALLTKADYAALRAEQAKALRGSVRDAERSTDPAFWDTGGRRQSTSDTVSER